MSVDFSQVLVNKPWGHEYLCYRNEVLAIWVLYIKSGHKTSLHCHPNKHTGLVVVDGSVKVRFLRGDVEITGLDKIHIFRARFHSTESLSEGGAYVLEIETPEDKHDLVRLQDAYGRSGQQYEGPKHFEDRPVDAIWISEPTESHSSPTWFRDCCIRHHGISKQAGLGNISDKEVFVIMRGGLSAGTNAQILWPGDVVDAPTLELLASNFEVMPNTTVLRLSKNA